MCKKSSRGGEVVGAYRLFFIYSPKLRSVVKGRSRYVDEPGDSISFEGGKPERG